MKWVRLVRGPLGDNGDDKVEEGEYVGGGPEKTMVFEPKDLVDIFAEKVILGEAEGPANYQNGISILYKLLNFLQVLFHLVNFVFLRYRCFKRISDGRGYLWEPCLAGTRAA